MPKAYLREWSLGGKRIWTLDTQTGMVKPLGLTSVCVEENFYRVLGSDGSPHNRIELLFGVVDVEIRRVQKLLIGLEDPNELEFDDLIGLSVSMAVQRMRTKQERRLQTQYAAWLAAQDPGNFESLVDEANPLKAAGAHTRALFEGMWEAADVLSLRQIELWDDPKGRFMTCDAPVIVPFSNMGSRDLHAAPYILWPVSPHRVVALTHDLVGEKAVIREATGKLVGLVRDGIQQGRERMIFASEEQRDRFPVGKKFRRRPQTRLRCSDRTPTGEYVEPPGCCVEWSVVFAAKPEVTLCASGLHREALELWNHV